MNFNIVEEENYSQQFWEQYEKIKTDVLNGLKTGDILEKHNLSRSSYRKYLKELQEEGLVERRSPPKFYQQLGNRFIVKKYDGVTCVYYGTYDTKEEAKAVISELKKCNWDKKQLPTIKEKIGIK